MSIRSAGGRLVAVKTANDAATSAKLGLEAQLLRRSAHPGVVTVVSFSSTGDQAELILGAPGERTVAEQMPVTLRDCLDFVAAIADTVADLHAMGVAHGALRPDHVLVGAQGQPVLCGFGAAQSVVDPRLFSADVIAIGELLAWLARRMPQDQRNARRVAAVVARSREHGPTARALAFMLADGHRDEVGSRAAIASHRSALGALIALATIATGAALFAGDGPSSSTAPATTVPSGSPSPTKEASQAPRIEVGGVSYQVGQPGDLAYFVPCRDDQRVILVRPGTGDIFVFDHLAQPGAPRTAQSVGRVAGALEIVPSADDSCSEIGVATEHSLLLLPVPTSTRSPR